MGIRGVLSTRLVAAGLAVLLGLMPSAMAQVVADPDGVIVRPGIMIHIDNGGVCTLGFLFRTIDETDAEAEPEYWAVTAAHCLPGPSNGVWPPDAGPTVFRWHEQPIGEVRAAVLDGSNDRDVALIHLSVPVDQLIPDVCFWGGPIGVHEDRHDGYEDLVIFGNGLDLEPRRLVGVIMDGDHVGHLGPVWSGDSGGPVLSADGRAVALHHASGLGVQNGRLPRTGKSVRLDVQLDELEDLTGLSLELLTADWREAQWPEHVVDDPEPGCPGLP